MKEKQTLDQDMVPLWQITRWAAYTYSDKQPPAVMFACKNLSDDDPDIEPIVLDYDDPRTSLQTAASLMNGGYEKVFFCFSATFQNIVGLGYMIFSRKKVQSGFAAREKISEFGDKIGVDEEDNLIFPEDEEVLLTHDVQHSCGVDYIIFDKGEFFMEGISQDIYFDELKRQEANKFLN
jgi:hypothetical protein